MAPPDTENRDDPATIPRTYLGGFAWITLQLRGRLR